ncbi:hypothetical protein, partial [Flammeovirga agarivorans]|uniref:hypothetical protein n=1 Tax=Flammeovirga agarivorans TaxID=2726742 RepID=UPI001B3B28AE
LKKYKKANKYFERGDFTNAKELLLKEQPYDYDVQNKLAMCYMELKMSNKICELLTTNNFTEAMKMKEKMCKKSTTSNIN